MSNLGEAALNARAVHHAMTEIAGSERASIAETRALHDLIEKQRVEREQLYNHLMGLRSEVKGLRTSLDHIWDIVQEEWRKKPEVVVVNNPAPRKRWGRQR